MKILLVLVSVIAPIVLQPKETPQWALDRLLTADRTFSESAASKSSVADALTPMFASDVLMPQPGGRFARGVNAAETALKANPDNAAKVEWTPIRGGVSADATQGFTFGYMTLRKPDGTTVPLKYMSYWVMTGAGWRVAAYKRARRPEGAVTAAMAAALPDKLVTPDRSRMAGAAAEVAAAEKAFSDESQTIGLGPAFVKYGSPDAVNMGPEAAFIVGNDKIGAFIGKGSPAPASPVRWAADEGVIAASSGDLGVSLGFIRPNAPASGGATPPNAFFTIWRKVNGVWKYIAE